MALVDGATFDTVSSKDQSPAVTHLEGFGGGGWRLGCLPTGLLNQLALRGAYAKSAYPL